MSRDSWLRPLAAAELAGAAGLVIGLVVAPIGVAAAIGLIGYFVGALGAHVRSHDSNLAGAGVILAVDVAALVLRVLSM